LNTNGSSEDIQRFWAQDIGGTGCLIRGKGQPANNDGGAAFGGLSHYKTGGCSDLIGKTNLSIF
jgi:hypothetical protein